jgi:hypothetical protein
MSATKKTEMIVTDEMLQNILAMRTASKMLMDMAKTQERRLLESENEIIQAMLAKNMTMNSRRFVIALEPDENGNNRLVIK